LPAATIPSSHRYIAQVTGLDVAVVGEKFAVLTEGFVLLSDGRLHHQQLEKHALRIMGRYGKDVEEHALAAAMALQDPEGFALVSVETAGSKARGRRALPRQFGFESNPDLRDWCAQNGYPTPQDQDWVMAGFVDYSLARNELSKDWAAAFRLWATKEISYGRLPPSLRVGAQAGLPLSQGSAFAGLTARNQSPGERARMNNAAAFGLESPMAARRG
jgi:hypothetical protein